MRKYIKQHLLEMADTLCEAAEYMSVADAAQAEQVRDDFLLMLSAMDDAVKQDAQRALEITKTLRDLFSPNTPDVDALLSLIGEYKATIEAVDATYKVLFLPYYANTWDSLKSVYEAFAQDPQYETEIVIIPISRNTPTGFKLVYEDYLTPQNVPNTHYSDYSFEEDLPDIVFYNNPYDGVNVPKFQMANIKRHAGLMVYVPYCLHAMRGDVFSIKEDFKKRAEITLYGLPGHDSADIFIVQSEAMKEWARNSRNKDKLVPLGNPKTDYIYNVKNSGVWPRCQEWENIIGGRTVFMLNTHYSFVFARAEDWSNLLFVKAVFDFIRTNKDAALIWRPHPQTFLMLDGDEAKDGLFMKYWEEAKQYENIIIDRTHSAISAMMYSKALISSYSSIASEYMAMDKPVCMPFINQENATQINSDDFKTEAGQRKYIVEENIDLCNVYMHQAIECVGLRGVCHEALGAISDDERVDIIKEHIGYIPIQNFMTDIMKGIDKKAEARKKHLEKAFVNLDGTCGRRILDHINNLLP